MGMDSGELEYWRNYFRSAKSSIIQVIENAVMVAALDCPDELKLHRGQIAEKLYTCQFCRISWADSTELVVPRKENAGGFGVQNKDSGSNNKLNSNGHKLNERDFKNRVEDDNGGGLMEDRGLKTRLNGNVGKLEVGGNLETKFDFSKNEKVDLFMTPVSIFSTDLEAEALTDEIDEENLTVGEVLRIKEVLDNREHQSDTILLESLRKLQLMALPFNILKATEIGKVVICLRKHRSKRISQLAWTLINDWRKEVDEWVNASSVVEDDKLEGTQNFIDSVNPSLIDDGLGLPLPPMDVGALFTSQISRIELSQFFDGMDDDGNPKSGEEFIENRDNGRKHSLDNHDMRKQKSHLPKDANSSVKDTGVTMKRESIAKSTKWPNNESGSRRLPKLDLEKKLVDERKVNQNSDMNIIQKRPSASRHEKFKFSDEVSVEDKIEAARKKLHEGYQQAENAKKRRTIQFVDVHELPKQGLPKKNPYCRRRLKTSYRHYTNR